MGTVNVSGVGSPRTSLENSSCAVLQTYSRNMASNCLQTNLNFMSSFLLLRLRRMQCSRIQRTNSGGKRSMVTEEKEVGTVNSLAAR